ncbi:membrane protein [Piptocephalis cylindrospora]|uniref:Mitochondrial fission 1 protein n=1 Tax=Piptocephalis cylindrospora TaxID=1907219 RepID=A0A4V1IXN9_9FUNG|nr:membrane protein [Piptocephalis cylindrospora]|eukprot:RKP11719.1 membrane protein [Piptocephalis cylindrospora]
MPAELPHIGEVEASLTPSELAVLRRQYEREQPKPSAQTCFNYAWGLVKSGKRQDQLMGVQLLSQVWKDQPERARECLYYLALGHHKLGAHLEARKYNDALLSLEPENRQAQELRTIIDYRVTREGLMGMTIVGGLIIGAGIVIAQVFRRS